MKNGRKIRLTLEEIEKVACAIEWAQAWDKTQGFYYDLIDWHRDRDGIFKLPTPLVCHLIAGYIINANRPANGEIQALAERFNK